MKAVNELKLSALNYAEKNKRPLKAIEDYLAGYNQCVDDLNKISLNGFKGVCKTIVAQRIKVVSNEFYDPNMGAGRRKELEENIKKLENMLDVILTTNLE